ncbi:MAG: hypothetical protein ACR2RV_18335 [Verrucomicrobiales bacterium]
MAGSASGATASSSKPIGYYQLDLDVGYQTVGVSVVNPALFGSWIGSSTATTITSSDTTADIGALMDETRAHYLEVVGGPSGAADPLVGQRFEVDVSATVAAGTADGVIVLEMDAETTTWVNDPPQVPTTAPALSGYRFELRAHVTLGQIFDPTLLYGSNSFAEADQIQVFNGSGFTIYYVLGDNSSFAQWTKQSGGDFSSNDKLPIAPGQGLVYKRSPQSSGKITLRVKGVARTTPFVQTMGAGFNFLSEPFPTSNSPEGRGAYPGAFNDQDSLQIYDGSGFTTYTLYSDGIETHLWLDSQFGNQNESKIFDYRRAVFVELDQPALGYRVEPPYAP